MPTIIVSEFLKYLQQCLQEGKTDKIEELINKSTWVKCADKSVNIIGCLLLIGHGSEEGITKIFKNLLEDPSFDLTNAARFITEKLITGKKVDLKTELHWGAEINEIGIVKFLIEKGCNINALNSNQQTALHLAVKESNKEIIEFLIENGCSVNAQNKDGNTALYNLIYSTKIDTIELVNLFITNGANAELENEYGATAFMAAASRGRLDICDLFINNGTDVNKVNKKGKAIWSEIWHLDTTKQIDVINFFAAKGADFKDKIITIDPEKCSPELLLSLLNKGVSSNFIKIINDGEKILHLVSKNETYLECLKIIIEEKNSDINVKSDSNHDYKTPLHYAIEANNTEAAELLIARGAKTDIQDGKGHTPLHIAVIKESKEYVELLLKCTDVNVKTNHGWTPLHIAVDGEKKTPNKEIIEILLNNGAKADLLNNNGNTALHFTCFDKSWDLFKLLLEHAKDVNIQNKEGFTYLHFVAEANKKDLVEQLLDKGANAIIQNKAGQKPLHMADYRSTDVVMLLLSKEDNINAQDAKGITYLHLAAGANNEEIVQLLLSNGANPAIKDKSGNTAITFAINHNALKAMNLLFDTKGFNLKKDGVKLLLDAAKSDKIEIVKLLAKKVKLNQKDNSNILELISYKNASTLEILKVLINNKNINEKDSDGWTHLYKAANEGNKDLIEFLLEKGADTSIVNNYQSTSLHALCYSQYGNIEGLKLLLDKGIDVNAQNKEGETSLHYAIKNKGKEYLKMLLEKGAKTNIKNNKGETVFDIAIDTFSNNTSTLDILKLLIENGADVNVKTKGGLTCVHILSSYDTQNAKELIELLVNKGADINLLDKEGNTALHIAASSGNWSIVRLLMEKGADINLLDKEGNTAFGYAVAKKQIDIAILLIQKGAKIEAAASKNLALSLSIENINKILKLEAVSLKEHNGEFLAYLPRSVNTYKVEESSKKILSDVLKSEKTLNLTFSETPTKINKELFLSIFSSKFYHMISSSGFNNKQLESFINSLKTEYEYLDHVISNTYNQFIKYYDLLKLIQYQLDKKTSNPLTDNKKILLDDSDSIIPLSKLHSILLDKENIVLLKQNIIELNSKLETEGKIENDDQILIQLLIEILPQIIESVPQSNEVKKLFNDLIKLLDPNTINKLVLDHLSNYELETKENIFQVLKKYDCVDTNKIWNEFTAKMDKINNDCTEIQESLIALMDMVDPEYLDKFNETNYISPIAALCNHFLNSRKACEEAVYSDDGEFLSALQKTAKAISSIFPNAKINALFKELIQLAEDPEEDDNYSEDGEEKLNLAGENQEDFVQPIQQNMDIGDDTNEVIDISATGIVDLGNTDL